MGVVNKDDGPKIEANGEDVPPATRRRTTERVVPEVSMNPNVIGKWQRVVVKQLVYQDCASSHAMNMQIFKDFAADRAAAGCWLCSTDASTRWSAARAARRSTRPRSCTASPG